MCLSSSAPATPLATISSPPPFLNLSVWGLPSSEAQPERNTSAVQTASLLSHPSVSKAWACPCFLSLCALLFSPPHLVQILQDCASDLPCPPCQSSSRRNRVFQKCSSEHFPAPPKTLPLSQTLRLKFTLLSPAPLFSLFLPLVQTHRLEFPNSGASHSPQAFASAGSSAPLLRTPFPWLHLLLLHHNYIITTS